jgi:hypothetical protein
LCCFFSALQNDDASLASLHAGETKSESHGESLLERSFAEAVKPRFSRDAGVRGGDGFGAVSAAFVSRRERFANGLGSLAKATDGVAGVAGVAVPPPSSRV